ncbi:MAG: glutamate-cysteine ligase family protein [Planctomycetota bacterium]
MGTQNVRSGQTGEERREFTRALLRDVEALEVMLDRGMIESGVNRIGAEQEMAIIDRSGRPFPINDQLLNDLHSDLFTTELGKFNIEYNLDPIAFGGECLNVMEDRINAMLAQIRAVAHKHGAQIVMAGILPSIAKDDLGLDNLSDRPRYRALNEVLNRMRGGPYELRINGVDELSVTHDSVMLEACNTSFQVHFQVSPSEFAHKYNIAQVVAAPVLAAASNSPMLFGRRLWHETRIALFEQSIDTRSSSSSMREFQGRVSFGTDWVRDSVLEIFQEDVARFKPLFPMDPEQDPLEVIEQGGVPKLRALCLHNGTVYRWNRACYGRTGGRPHLRIENRVLPSGPTPADEVANAALWFGLMRGMSETYPDITTELSFDDVRANFIAAARQGLDAQLHWIGGITVPARELIALKILPLAQRGLEAAGISGTQIDRYLGIIQDRASVGQTGSIWMLKSYAGMPKRTTRGERMCRLSTAIARRQLHGTPVHTWKPIDESEFEGDKQHIMTVGQYMTTDLFTVHQNDVVDLVTNLMDWKHIRHVPVEDDDHRLVGLVSHRDLLRHLGRARDREDLDARPVSEIMKPDPITVSPQSTTLEVINVMRTHQISCLPVVENDRLVGVITEHDLMQIAAPLLERFLSD